MKKLIIKFYYDIFRKGRLEHGYKLLDLFWFGVTSQFKNLKRFVSFLLTN